VLSLSWPACFSLSPSLSSMYVFFKPISTDEAQNVQYCHLASNSALHAAAEARLCPSKRPRLQSATDKSTIEFHSMDIDQSRTNVTSLERHWLVLFKHV
jgi:hypothetical protein